MTAQKRPEQHLRGRGRDALDLERQEEHEAERGEHHHPFERRAEDRRVEGRRRGHEERDHAGQGKAQAHVVVDLQHVLPEALVEFSRRGPTACRAAAVGKGFSHRLLLQR